MRYAGVILLEFRRLLCPRCGRAHCRSCTRRGTQCMFPGRIHRSTWPSCGAGTWWWCALAGGTHSTSACPGMIDLQSPKRPDMHEIIVESPMHIRKHRKAPLIHVTYDRFSQKYIGGEVDVPKVRQTILGRRTSQDRRMITKTHLRGWQRSGQHHQMLKTRRKTQREQGYPDSSFRVRRVASLRRDEATGITMVLDRQRQCAGRRRCCWGRRWCRRRRHHHEDRSTPFCGLSGCKAPRSSVVWHFSCLEARGTPAGSPGGTMAAVGTSV